MRVIMPPFNLGPRTLFTARSNTSWLFFPFTGPMETASIKDVKLMFALWNITADFRAQAGVRYVDDGLSWGSATGFGSVVNTTTPEFGSFVALQGTPLRLAQVGLLCANVSGSTLELAEGVIGLSTRTF